MSATTKVLVITDNAYLVKKFKEIVTNTIELGKTEFYYACSAASVSSMAGLVTTMVQVRTEWPQLVSLYNLVISIHCKQLFPAEMVAAIRCINLHPGLNPYNRGWFPQVFSILNKLPLGATIHEIDEKLDHGGIIAQQQVPVYAYDTSLTAYNRVQAAELKLLEQHIVAIINGTYATTDPVIEGNLNLKKNFDQLLELDLNEVQTMGQALDRLRALTHGSYRNAYFRDEAGQKIFVCLDLQPE